MYNTAIILGAGNSTRMQSSESKLLLNLSGKTVLRRSYEIFSSLAFINDIFITCRKSDLPAFQKILNNEDVHFIIGGSSRSESVYNAILQIKESDFIFIHDGARPLTDSKDVLNVYKAAQKHGGAALGTPVTDTIKKVNSDLKILDTPVREELYAVQTPQVFNFSVFKRLISNAINNNLQYTDDCALFEKNGLDCYIVKGSYDNIKITTKSDISIAESILSKRCNK